MHQTLFIFNSIDTKTQQDTEDDNINRTNRIK